MMQIVLIGIAAGATGALLFASVASGSAFSLVLVNLAPLPVLIAALGWSHWAGLVAALFSAVAAGLLLGPFFLATFLLAVGLPAWWIGYLSLLARPATGPAGTPNHLEWYPIGRIVLWTAMLAAAGVIAVIPLVGLDAEAFRNALRSALERLLQVLSQTSPSERVLDVLSAIALPAAAVSSTIVNVVNLWLAARIVKVSGRLRRPWPDLSAIAFPSAAPLLLIGALAGSFLTGLLGISFAIVTASLLMAYAFLGFAVLHAITRGMDARPFVLGGVYIVIIAFNGLLLLMSLLGIADTIFNLRTHVARKRGPPAPQP